MLALGGRGRDIRRFAVHFGLALCCAGAAHAQSAAPTLATLCSPAAFPLTLDQAALARVTTEVSAAATGQTPIAADWLSRSLAGADKPDLAQVAGACLAGGEWLRTAREGNPVQAKAFLAAAVRQAFEGRDAALAARASYRLGLAALSGDAATGAGTRGARVTVPPDDAADAPGEDGPCDVVARPGFTRLASRFAARSAFECAIARARASGEAEIAAQAALRLARFAIVQAGANAGLVRRLAQDVAPIAVAGLADARAIPDPERRADYVTRLAEAALDARSGDTSTIAAALDAVAVTAGARAFVAAMQGRIALARGDSEAAAAAFERAVFIEGQRERPQMLPTWLMLLAEAQPARRTTLVRQAYQAQELLRPITPAADALTEESLFALRMRPVFEAAVAVELGAGGSEPTHAGIATAQRIVEAYRQAELQNAFGTNCVPARDPVDPARLRIGEVLLYPILLDDRVELLVVIGGAGARASFVRMPGGRAASRQSVSLLVDDMVSSASRGSDDEWRGAGHALYDLLIKPVEALLKPGGTLVIIPDGALRALPFAALTDSEGHFLIERTRLAVAPALAFSQPGTDRRGGAPRIVAAALQREVSLPAGVFAKLEGTAEEAGVAAGPNGQILSDFSESDLRRALSRGRVDILHLATHAAFNGRSDRSFIVANGAAIPLADLRALIAANRLRGDELDLLVLSACETAVGDDEASMGLAGAAVQSGAESALASLWSVNDTGTVALMKGFYGAYRQGAGRAEALRAAQLAMIARGGEAAQPGIWAAFVLLGGWR